MDVGDKLPKFTATTTSGKTITNKELLGKNVVLYFYSKDNTSGCTQEGKDFTTHHAAFDRLNCEVFGVSRDSVKSHEKFKQKFCFPFELIADEDQNLCTLFDVIKQKSMFGKQVQGIVRSTFLIDSSGRIRHVWRNVKVPGHVESVLQELKNIS